MSADLLRRAAAEMRANARGATAGPWHLHVLSEAYVGNRADGRTSGLYDIVHASGETLADLTDSGRQIDVANARHIASWHPAVALAVADWLDAVEAESMTQAGSDALVYNSAVAVARAYLGEVQS